MHKSDYVVLDIHANEVLVSLEVDFEGLLQNRRDVVFLGFDTLSKLSDIGSCAHIKCDLRALAIKGNGQGVYDVLGEEAFGDAGELEVHDALQDAAVVVEGQREIVRQVVERRVVQT